MLRAFAGPDGIVCGRIAYGIAWSRQMMASVILVFSPTVSSKGTPENLDINEQNAFESKCRKKSLWTIALSDPGRVVCRSNVNVLQVARREGCGSAFCGGFCLQSVEVWKCGSAFQPHKFRDQSSASTRTYWWIGSGSRNLILLANLGLIQNSWYPCWQPSVNQLSDFSKFAKRCK